MQENVFPFRMPESVFVGVGSLSHLGTEARRLGGKRALIVTDKGVAGAGIAEQARRILVEAGVEGAVFDATAAEPPFDNVDQVLDLCRSTDANLLVGVGGGSALDVAKGCAAMMTNPGRLLDYAGVDKLPNPALPMIGVPTTAGTGSEATPNAIFTDTQAKLKKGVVSPYLIPRVAIVDPALTLSAPTGVTAATGMDALTHAVESYTSRKATPLTKLYSLEAIRLIAAALRTAVHDGSNLEARRGMALGSFFAGVGIGNAGTAAVHAMAYPLGGQFGIPHGVANALMLPYVLEVNFVANLEDFAAVAVAMGEPVGGRSPRAAAQAALEACRQISIDVGIPQRLRDVGVPSEAIPGMAEAAAATTRLMDNNPRKLNVKDVRKIYEAAF